MKKLGLIVPSLCLVVLAGCGTAQPQAATTPTTAPSTASVTPTPAPTPTPTAMSDQAAGKYFLDTICPANKLLLPLDTAMQAKPLDIQTARAAAGAYRDGLATAAKQLSAPQLPWPAPVKADVDGFVTDLYSDISDADNISGQTSANAVIGAWNNWKDSGAGAKAQAVRVKLGLPTDARASCGM